MFAFEYPLTGDFINVYFDLKHFYFDRREIMNLAGVAEKKGRRRIVNKMRKLKFLRPHQVVALLDCFLYTKKIQGYILNVVYPVLMGYKKSLVL
jgi:hypothetical protein